MMLTLDHIKEALGDEFEEGVNYVLCDPGENLVSKLSKGYTRVGKIPDDYTPGFGKMFILRPPVPKATEKEAGE